MADTDEVGASRFGRSARIAGLTAALLFLVAVGIGFTAGAARHDGFSRTDVIVLGSIMLLLLGAGFLLVRQLKSQTGEDPLTPKERTNRNLLIVSGLLGGATSLALAFAVEGGLERGALSNAPLPPGVAILLILVIGVLVPALSLYWHRVIDEQEADAYKTGAVYAFYVFGIGAPVWWLAWRGGFVPAPNGFVIYFATVFILGVVWLWKKYR